MKTYKCERCASWLCDDEHRAYPLPGETIPRYWCSHHECYKTYYQACKEFTRCKEGRRKHARSFPKPSELDDLLELLSEITADTGVQTWTLGEIKDIIEQLKEQKE